MDKYTQIYRQDQPDGEREPGQWQSTEQFDAELARDGFQLGPPEMPNLLRGLNGKDTEKKMLCPSNKWKEWSRRPPEEVEEIEDRNEAIHDAIDHNLSNSTYNQWRIHASVWMRSLDKHLCHLAAKDPRFAETRSIAPDFPQRLIKPIVSANRSLDIHHGVDLFFIFHDPTAFNAARKSFREREGSDGSEALYWDTKHDTIVTVDVTMDIDVKLDRVFQKTRHDNTKADIIASKIGTRANPALLQYIGETGRKHDEKLFDQRLRTLAQLILDTYFAKKEEVKRRRIAQQNSAVRTETKDVLVLAEERKKREAARRAKEEERKKLSELAKQQKEARRKANEAMLRQQTAKPHLKKQQG